MVQNHLYSALAHLRRVFFFVFLVIGPSILELGPPINPGRFTLTASVVIRSTRLYARADCCPDDRKIMIKDLSALRDPRSGSLLTNADDVLRGATGHEYPIVNGIPRFVERDNYANDFGSQWNRFPKTQLDSHTKLTLSENRLERCLGERLGNLRGKMVLEAGSGAGRFTEVLLKYGAVVHSFDYSNAVEANKGNN